VSIDKETWKLADGLEDALDALREKAKEAAAVERAGIKTEADDKKFQDLLKEKAQLGTRVRECAEARTKVELTVPLELRQAVGQAEVALRQAQGVRESKRRAVTAQKRLVEALEAETKGSDQHANDVQQAKDSLKEKQAELDEADAKVEQAKDVVARAQATAKPKRPK
jgi:chromosome segregation ATPase